MKFFNNSSNPAFVSRLEEVSINANNTSADGFVGSLSYLSSLNSNVSRNCYLDQTSLLHTIYFITLGKFGAAVFHISLFRSHVKVALMHLVW